MTVMVTGGAQLLAEGPASGVYAHPVTDRQRLVLELVARGLATKEIAAALGISEPGAKKHVATLLRRFAAPNRAALVRSAIAAGALGPSDG